MYSVQPKVEWPNHSALGSEDGQELVSDESHKLQVRGLAPVEAMAFAWTSWSGTCSWAESGSNQTVRVSAAESGDLRLMDARDDQQGMDGGLVRNEAHKIDVAV